MTFVDCSYRGRDQKDLMLVINSNEDCTHLEMLQVESQSSFLYLKHFSK
jgi:hypothetical protein